MGELEEILGSAASLDARGETYSLATVVRVDGSSYRRPGARLLVPREGPPIGLISGGCLEEEAARLARAAIDGSRPMLLKIDHSAEGDELWGLGLGCRGVVHLFAEPPPLARDTLETIRSVRGGHPTSYLLTGLDGSRRRLSPEEAATLADGAEPDRPLLVDDTVLDPIIPPTHLVICGAGPDAVALAVAARRLDWRVTVADPRRSLLANERFGDVERCDAEPSDAPDRIGVTGRTAVVIMGHDYVRDGAYLGAFIGRGAAYVGVVGPRERTDRLLVEGGAIADESLHAPAGLDIGADGPEEVATAVVAEIVAVLHGHAGGPLRDRQGPIHGVSRR
jgi:xanthine dehydrogenase accessory factor